MTAKAELRISPDLSLPLDATTEAFGIIGQRGSGKTVTAKVMAEEMAKRALPVVVLDPLGVWFGIRSSVDGKGPGLPFQILGGEHGDIPLESTAGEVVADFCVDRSPLVVLDLSGFRKAEMRRFARAFLDRLYHRNRDPLHLIVDEADLFAPQNTGASREEKGAAASLLGSMEDIVRRGRARGLGITMVTQRPAVLNKDVLSQISTLVAMRTVGLQDRNALDEWTRGRATAEETKQLKASLPSLPTGTAWFWSPSWLDVFEKVRIRAPETFDSSATPKGGAKVVEPRVRADIDLAELKEAMADTIERAKATDPKELQREVTRLRRELAAAQKAKPAPEPVVETVEVPVISDALRDEVTALMDRCGDLVEDLSSAWPTASLRGLEEKLAAAVNWQPSRVRRAVGVAQPAAPVTPSRPAPVPRQQVDVEGLTPQQTKMLAELARRHPMALTPRQLATWSGFSMRSSSWGPSLKVLREAGYTVEEGGRLVITDAGLEAAGVAPEAPLSGPEVVEMWCRRLPPQAAAFLRALVAVPDGLSDQELHAATGYSLTSSSWGAALKVLRDNGLAWTDSDDVHRAAEELAG